MTTKHNFKNREEIKIYLLEQMNELNRKGEFNIFVHQINNYKNYLDSGKDVLQKKICGIVDDGLRLGKYSSIFGTTNLVASSLERNVDPVIDYNYYRNSDFPILVVAIPKYIDVDGKKVEFSSYKNNTEGAREEIKNEFRTNGIYESNHNIKSCLFDVLKGYNNLPKHYILGVLIKNGNEYSFVENNEHLKNLSDADFAKYKDCVANKIKTKYDEFSTEEPLTLMIKSFRTEQKWRDEQLLDYD